MEKMEKKTYGEKKTMDNCYFLHGFFRWETPGHFPENLMENRLRKLRYLGSFASHLSRIPDFCSEKAGGNHQSLDWFKGKSTGNHGFY